MDKLAGGEEQVKTCLDARRSIRRRGTVSTAFCASGGEKTPRMKADAAARDFTHQCSKRGKFPLFFKKNIPEKNEQTDNLRKNNGFSPQNGKKCAFSKAMG